jgi:CubicO group peptidase (beta-lactamase class C family)
MSVGVIYGGQTVLKHNFGVLDIETQRKTTSDTLYCIASLSKAFMAASLDLLVSQKKVNWDSPVCSVIPDFKHVEKPEVYSGMTIRDICSHRTGLLSLDEVTQGLDGRILVPKADVIRVCNGLPIKHDLRSRFLYNNAMYELAGNVVESLSGESTWGDFQQHHIFGPLRMSRTTAFNNVHETEKNVATPYMVLTNGTRSKIKPTELSANSMNGGSGGIRSSVNDLLLWAHCLIDSFNNDSVGNDSLRAHSPIFDRSTIANPYAAEKGDYCTGWCYHRTPACLGLISPNRDLESPIVGAESPSVLVYGHQGDVPGYTCNMYILPETRAAIVILSNGTGLSDATDWIAQDLIQTMHSLQPSIDFVSAAEHSKTKYLSWYTKHWQIPIEENREKNRKPNAPTPPLQDFIGTYIMEDIPTICIKVYVDLEDMTSMKMMINRQSDQVWDLRHHYDDIFSHLPESYDDCLRRGIFRTHWSSFLTTFERDESAVVEKLCWKMDEVGVYFRRMDPT